MTVASPMIDPVGLDYDLQLLPRGRTPFRRWHWELWHGPVLLAAGWRLHPLEAQRSIRVHAVRYAHRLHGLRVLHAEVDHPAEIPWQGRTERFAWGALQIELRPRAPRPATPDLSASRQAG